MAKKGAKKLAMKSLQMVGKMVGKVFAVIGYFQDLAQLIEQGRSAVKRGQAGNLNYYKNAKLVQFGHVIDFPEVSRGNNGQNDAFRPSHIAVEPEDLKKDGRLGHIPTEKHFGKVGRTYLHHVRTEGVSRDYFAKNTLSDLCHCDVEFEPEANPGLNASARMQRGSKVIELKEPLKGLRRGMPLEGDGIPANTIVEDFHMEFQISNIAGATFESEHNSQISYYLPVTENQVITGVDGTFYYAKTAAAAGDPFQISETSGVRLFQVNPP